MDPPQKQPQPAPQQPQQMPQYQPQPNVYPAGGPYGAPQPGAQQPTYVYAQQPQYAPAGAYVAAAPGVIPVAPVMGPPGQTLVVVEQTTYFGSQPVQCVCPNCRAQIVTNVVYTPGAMAWLSCVLLCVVGAWPCAPIPFCVTGCQDASHYCPNCNCLVRRRDAMD